LIVARLADLCGENVMARDDAPAHTRPREMGFELAVPGVEDYVEHVTRRAGTQ
jgi:hypothetical protein